MRTDYNDHLTGAFQSSSPCWPASWWLGRARNKDQGGDDEAQMDDSVEFCRRHSGQPHRADTHPGHGCNQCRRMDKKPDTAMKDMSEMTKTMSELMKKMGETMQWMQE